MFFSLQGERSLWLVCAYLVQFYKQLLDGVTASMEELYVLQPCRWSCILYVCILYGVS